MSIVPSDVLEMNGRTNEGLDVACLTGRLRSGDDVIVLGSVLGLVLSSRKIDDDIRRRITTTSYEHAVGATNFAATCDLVGVAVIG